jgi:hypothetical protein
MSAAAALMISTIPALADDCTEKTLQAEAMEATTRMREIAQTNPEKLAEISPRIQEASTRVQDGADLEETCAYCDELLADMGE